MVAAVFFFCCFFLVHPLGANGVMKNWFCGFASLSLLLTAVAGCGDGAERPDRYPVSGTVMYNGATVSGATVSFWADGAARPATGVTDDEGKFQLTMFEPYDGAVAGEHKVTVLKVEESAAPVGRPEDALDDPSAMTDMMAQQGAGGNSGPKYLVPQKYSDKAATPLKETVTPDGENTFVFQLTD